jgi:phosphoribosylamine--glycine ligase
MRVLVVGNGAREHALVWRLGQSPQVAHLIAAPGNAGIAETIACFAVAIDDVDGLVALAQAQAIDFVVVGPEAPLTLGLVDRLEALGILALGPTQAAARLEGSKAFTKAICSSHHIPTADYASFDQPDQAKAYIRAKGAPIVIKADGLAAGKGVVVAQTLDDALAAVDELLVPKLGGRLVIEECLTGEEMSFFALCDGTRAVSLGAAQDHKRAFDGDLGPNTGGMGAFGPPPLFTPALEAQVMKRIIAPTLAAMADMGAPFKGILFAGLMITPDGTAKLIEFNVRFGDPETQVLMMRLDGDLIPVLVAAARGDLGAISAPAQSGAALCVVYAANGYPGTPLAGTVIGLPKELAPDARIFHAGTARDPQGHLVARGGRVLSICAKAPTLAKAKTIAYDTIKRIDWPQGFYRRDIGGRIGEP